jgi:uncharacterized protein YigA (DUF484 family)
LPKTSQKATNLEELNVKKKRVRRGGTLALARAGLPKPSKPTAQQLLRKHAADAREKYPSLAKKLDRLRDAARQFEQPVYDLADHLHASYRQIRSWHDKEELLKRLEQTAAISGSHKRKGANVLLPYVRATSSIDDRRELSRRATILADALAKKIDVDEFRDYLKRGSR